MDRPNEAARAAADQTEPENGLRHLFRSSPHRHEPAGAEAPPSSAGAAASFSRNEKANSTIVMKAITAGTIQIARQSCPRSEEHTSELQSLMRIQYAVFCLKKKKNNI